MAWFGIFSMLNALRVPAKGRLWTIARQGDRRPAKGWRLSKSLVDGRRQIGKANPILANARFAGFANIRFEKSAAPDTPARAEECRGLRAGQQQPDVIFLFIRPIEGDPNAAGSKPQQASHGADNGPGRAIGFDAGDLAN
jgi:hypothetical protein